VIDEDQGRSGRTVEQRPGFQRLLAEVTLDHVGLVLGLELSRLSRSSKDWYHLLELCAVFGTLLADQDGIYDASDSNDRLVLGLKGTMSEVELTTMRNRLERGKLHKAERGELILTVPCGYLKLPHGEVILDPDEQVRAVVQLVFDKFAELGSFSKVYRYLRQNKISAGCRVQKGPRRGELVWRPISRALLGRMLHHPIYAGAYSYGRRRVDPKRTAANGGKVRMWYVPMSEMEGPQARPLAGLYHVGALPGQSTTAVRKPFVAGYSRRAPRWRGAAARSACLWGVWPTHARRLSNQS